MVSPAEPAPMLRRNPEYLRWLLGDLCLDLGNAIGTFAFPLITFAATGSLGATGLVGLVQGIGGVLGMIPGGLLADRYERRGLRLLAGGTGVIMQVLLIVALLAGWASMPVLAVIAFVDRFRATLLGSASDAMLKQIVPPIQLPRAVAVNEGREAAVEMVSGPLGGVLFSLSIVFPPLAQLLGSLGSLIATLGMTGRYRPRVEGADRTRVRDDLREAVVWSVSQSIRLQLMAVAVTVNLGVSGLFLTVLLDLASDGVPAVQIGLLNTVFAASILVGAVAAPPLVSRVPTGVLAVVPVLAMALAGTVVPFAPNLFVIAAAYAVMGIGLAPLNAAAQGFFLHITPVAMQGRIDSFMGLVAMGLMPLGPAIAGWGLEIVGPRPTMLVFVGITALSALIVLLGRDLRRVPVAAGWESFARTEGLAAVEPDAGEPDAEYGTGTPPDHG